MSSKTNNVLSLPCPRENVEGVIKEMMVKDKTECVIFLSHALERMEQRKITNRQIFQAIKNGRLDIPPEWDTKKENGWKCRFKGIGAGKSIKVAVKLVSRPNKDVTLIITVFEG